MNKIGLLYIGAIALILWLLGTGLNSFTPLSMNPQWLNLTFSVGWIFLALFQLFQGSFIKIKWSRISLICCVGLLLVGALWKVLHWQGANILLTVGLISPMLLYTPHFFLKKSKGYVDFLKYAWVLTFFTGTLRNMFQGAYASELLIASNIILLFLSLDWIMKHRKVPG